MESSIPVKSMVNNSVSQGKKVVNNSYNNIKDASTNVYNKIMSQLNYYTNRPEVIFGLIFVIVFSVVIAYFMYKYIAEKVFNHNKLIVNETKAGISGNKKHKIILDNKILSGNGLKRSYTFWMYIKDFSHTGFKNVFYFGKENDILQRSIQIFLENRKNKLFIRFKKIDENTSDKTQQILSDFESEGTYTEAFKEYMKQGICIEYIPIQRWVHVGIVVNDIGTSGGSISTYVDGDLVGIANHGEKLKGLGENIDSEMKYDIKNYDLDSTDNLVIGGAYNDNEQGFSGLLSKLTLFNYDLNDRDIYNNYNSGPIDNVLDKLGLGSYGIRNPIYKIK
jgi:hypothetical protein|tara:strand:+ start:6209 stop:7213 length:1005 start_codon:yes stop_codon:yes gene_type:complete